MKLHTFTIPDDPAGVADWLERYLAGPDLAALVAELSAVHGPSAGPEASVREVLGPRLEPVLAGGLKALPLPLLRQFLVRPGLLLDLQEQVLVEGGPYWDQVIGESSEIRSLVERGRERLKTIVAAEERKDRPRPVVGPLRAEAAWYLHPGVVSLATAAAVLLGVFLYQKYGFGPAPPQAAAVAWGWAKPGALPEGGSARAYLNTLADEAGDWFKKRPEDRTALARRILQFRQGCATLIFAPHSPLAARDRQWLVEKCRLWGANLDQQLQALESGADLLQVRAKTDQVINNLITTLRTRAAEPPA